MFYIIGCQTDIRKTMIDSIKKVFPTQEKYKSDAIFEKLEAKYEKLERGFLRHLRKHLRYEGHPLEVFNYGAAENELGDKSPLPAAEAKFPEEKEEKKEDEENPEGENNEANNMEDNENNENNENPPEEPPVDE